MTPSSLSGSGVSGRVLSATSARSAMPLAGRSRELTTIAALAHDAAAGSGRVLLLSGDGGVGKTRLVAEAATALRETWHVAVGRAYALETAIAYAPFADALQPLFAAMEAGQVTRVTRGDPAVLAALAPTLPSATSASAAAMRGARDGAVNAAEARVRLHAAILGCIARLAERRPLLLVLENLHWADSASVELFHFLARQLDAHRVLLVGTWNDTERELPDNLRATVRSLRSLGAAHDLHLEPLTLPDLTGLLAERFAVDAEAVGPFAGTLHDATRGNPFFIEQTLRELVERGELRRGPDASGGVWTGFHLDTLTLPRTVREVLGARLERLGADARHVGEHVAVAGTSVSHEVLREIASLPEAGLLAALGELRADGIVHEQADGATVSYDVAHPMLRQALVDAVGLARERAMHASIATAIAQVHGDDADRQAESIAAHWTRADPRTEPATAIRWLVLAGRRAATRYARREAATMLRAALDRADAAPDAVAPSLIPELLDELSRLYRRLGEYQRAIDTLQRARELAAQRGDAIGIAITERRLGMACEGLSRRVEAIAHFDAGIAHAAGDPTLLARLHLAKGDCLQALGRPDDAKREIAFALDLAERLDQLPLLARAHRALLMLHLWSGPAHRAWAHARSAVELAERSGERNLAWSAHWSAAVLGALTANTSSLQRHLAEATRLADELRSPLLQLRTAEIMIEYRAGVGEWDRALVEGERAIARARALDQTTLLARLLHWVGGVYLHRGDVEQAKRLFDEAWRVSDADAVDLEQPFLVHGVLPAYVARVAYLGATGAWADAMHLGATAMTMADRTGYIAWAVYRLLPAIAEAALAANDRETLASVRDRLAHHAGWLAHPIGLAWVAVIDGECALRDGRADEAVTLLQRAVSALEAVPYAFDAAAARLRLARALQATGDVEEAVRETRAALQLLDALGARPAADAARALLRTLGGRVPAARRDAGFDGLTGRELEIVRHVARRLSNKEIGVRLDISARTVGTHLANIFDKTGVRDRTALGDLAREQGLHRA